MRKFYPLVCLLFFFFALAESRAQSSQITTYGKDFWISFPGGYPDINDFYGGAYLVFSSKENASVHIEMPSVGISATLSLTAHVAKTFDLPTSVSNFTSEVINNKSMHITADKDINVYSVSIGGADDDGSIYFPKPALDTFYVISMAGNYYANCFNVVATCDSTVVELTHSDTTWAGHIPGSTQSYLLNQGDVLPVYTRQAFTFPSILRDLSGTTVKSNKKVTVIANTTSYYIPLDGVCCADMMFHQLLPTTLWGNKHFIAQHRFCTVNYYEITSLKNANQILIDGIADTTLNQYEKYGFMLSGDHIIESDFAVQVVQYQVSESYDAIDGNGDPSTLLMLPAYCPQDSVAFYAKLPSAAWSTDSAFANIIAPTSTCAFVQLDGNFIAASFTPFAYDGSYSVAKVPLDTGRHMITSPYDFMAYYIEMYSQGGHVYELGGYIKDVALISGFEHKTDTVICEDDSITLQLLNPGWQHMWEDGSVNASRVVSDSGFYRVSVFHDCDTLFQTIHVGFIDCDTTPPVDTTPVDTLPIDTLPIDSSGNLSMPNAFSPNGDGINDFIEPLTDGDVIVELFLVFNRWGQKVFDSAESGTLQWNGRLKNTPQPLGTYVYLINYSQGGETKSVNGGLQLIR